MFKIAQEEFLGFIPNLKNAAIIKLKNEAIKRNGFSGKIGNELSKLQDAHQALLKTKFGKAMTGWQAAASHVPGNDFARTVGVLGEVAGTALYRGRDVITSGEDFSMGKLKDYARRKVRVLNKAIKENKMLKGIAKAIAKIR